MTLAYTEAVRALENQRTAIDSSHLLAALAVVGLVLQGNLWFAIPGLALAVVNLWPKRKFTLSTDPRKVADKEGNSPVESYVWLVGSLDRNYLKNRRNLRILRYSSLGSLAILALSVLV